MSDLQKDKAKSRWANMTPEQKAERIAKMQAGRLKIKESGEFNNIVESIVGQIKEIVEVSKKKRGRPSKQNVDPVVPNIDLSKIIQYEGKQYIKVERNEVIKLGAIQKFKDFRYMPLKNESSIGCYPCNFSDERNFFNPIN